MFKTKNLIQKLFCLLLVSTFCNNVSSQLTEACKLDIGTNMAGLVDYGTEIAFVNVMKSARTWYTKDIGNPNGPFDSGHTENLSMRPDGYPTHIPQTIPMSNYPQKVVTIWAITDGWTPGEYTILWEGTGTFSFWGSHQNLNQTGSHRMVFDYPNPIDGVFELTIESSDINDPIHNIRILMPGTEFTYESEPFNPVWLEKILNFKTIRFMDWGQTNNWGETNGWNVPTLFDWSERSQMDHYTWAYEKGVPYEMMVKLMNDFDLEGWVCVPHRASDNYMSAMASYFFNNLETERHLTIEYSNEIWNWIFGQTQWVFEYGCVQTGLDWPAGIVPYIQNCLDHFTNAFSGDPSRITRAVGAFTGWPAITDTIVSNLTPGSFDAIATTFYFGLTEDADAALDALGATATVNDIAYYARSNMSEALQLIREHKTEMADPRGIPLIFYEGGQHLTPHPFGVHPTYEQALMDVQRDTAMFNLYNEWFDSLRTLQSGSEPLQLLHFSLVGQRSARYGSWGMLESMDQDTTVIPAPKYSAILNNKAADLCGQSPLGVAWGDYNIQVDDCYAKLNWTTLAENNSSHFQISRSADGWNYQIVGRIPAVGESSVQESYEYIDYLNNSGKYYYRILQIDYDGSKTELETRQVNLDCEISGGISIYPNPVRNMLSVSFKNAVSDQNYKITDGIGRYISIGHIVDIQKGGKKEIDINHLPQGVYYITFIKQHRTITKKFVKIE